MTSFRSRIAGITALIAFAVPISAAESFLGPAIESLLDGNTARGEVSAVLWQRGERQPVFSRWAGFERPVPLGSLVKPFTALAYAEAHGNRFPTVECSAASRCWLPSGHASVGIEDAIAYSCNTYFRRLSEQLNAGDLAAVTLRFALPAPPHSAPAESYFGIGDEWRISPPAMLRAYENLARRVAEPLAPAILAGLKASAAIGTAAGVGRALGGASALAKTGTAPCIHQQKMRTPWTGDGYALVLFPARHPRYSLIVRVHGVPGREAAVLAGRIMRLAAGGPSLSGHAPEAAR